MRKTDIIKYVLREYLEIDQLSEDQIKSIVKSLARNNPPMELQEKIDEKELKKLHNFSYQLFHSKVNSVGFAKRLVSLRRIIEVENKLAEISQQIFNAISRNEVSIEVVWTDLSMVQIDEIKKTLAKLDYVWEGNTLYGWE